MITQWGLTVVRIKLVYGNHSLSMLAMCNTESSISFVDRPIVSTLQLQGRKASSSVAGIHVLQEFKTETVPIAVSAHKMSRPLTTVQFTDNDKLKFGDQIVERLLKDCYSHLKNLRNHSYNLNEVLVILGQDCYDIHHPLDFKKSNDRTATWKF